MSDPIDSTTPPAVPYSEHAASNASAPESSGSWTTTHTGYTQAPPPGAGQPPYTGQPPYGTPPPPGGYAVPAAGSGISDSAAGAIAYITFIPALIFLLVDPYKQKPFIRFHAIQEIGLTLVGLVVNLAFHFLGFIGVVLWGLCWIVLLIVWLLCVLKASQGGSFKLPLIGKFAAEQSGYNV